MPRTGIEPALPFDNKILSLARLPVPPSGLRGAKIAQLFIFSNIFVKNKLESAEIGNFVLLTGLTGIDSVDL